MSSEVRNQGPSVEQGALQPSHEADWRSLVRRFGVGLALGLVVAIALTWIR